MRLRRNANDLQFKNLVSLRKKNVQSLDLIITYVEPMLKVLNIFHHAALLLAEMFIILID